jgi:thiamine kinase-like enzyme
MWQLAFHRSRPTFEARYRSQMSPRLPELLDWLDRHGVELARVFQRSAPETLLHADSRLDNLFFDDREPEHGVVAIDWQGASRGPGAFDVAYFLSASLDPDVSDGTIRELLRAYHVELEANGVRGYDFEACQRDYERALLLILQRMVTIEALDLGEQRGAALIDASLRRIGARLHAIEPDRVLPARGAGSPATSSPP